MQNELKHRKRIAEIKEKLKGRYKMTFEEAIEIIEEECRVEAEDGFSTKEKDLDTFLALSIINKLQETYAPKIKMTFKQKDNLMLFIDEDDDFEDFWCYFGKFGYGIELYKEFSEKELMHAWLHPELIEVSDE